MKAINRAIVLAAVSYCILLSGMIFYTQYQQQEQAKLYNVELNRCYYDLQDGVSAEALMGQPLNYVTEIDVLDADDFDGTDPGGFFSGYNSAAGNFRIYPIYQEGRVESFVRLSYQKDRTSEQILWRSGLTVIVLSALASLSLLFYIKHRVVKPYLALNEQVAELTKGVYLDRVYTTGGYFRELSWKLGVLSKTLVREKEMRLNTEREKATLLASLSHNIKTPLQTIHLYSQALADGLPGSDAEEKNAALKIAEKAGQIDGIVKELISQTGAFDRNIEIKPETFYLDKLLSAVQTRWQPELKLRNTAFETEPYKNRLVNADYYRLLEVFDNIINNALKYGDGERIEIQVTEEEYHTAVRIRNTGESCSKEEIPFLFSSYWRGSNAKNKEGSGMGLFTCKKLMQLMDGDVYAATWEHGFEAVLILEDAD